MKKNIKKKIKARRRSSRKIKTRKRKKKQKGFKKNFSNKIIKSNKKKKLSKKSKKIRINKKATIKKKIKKNIKSKKIKKFIIEKPKFINKFKAEFLNKISIGKFIVKLFDPIINAYNKYLVNKKIKKFNEIEEKSKLQITEMLYEEKKRDDILKKELKQAKIFSIKRKKLLLDVLKKEQQLIRQNEKLRIRKFNESLRVQAQLDRFAIREQKEIENLHKLSLKYEKEDYKKLQDRIDIIRQRYVFLKQEKIKQRVEELAGEKFTEDVSIEEIRKKEKAILESKQLITSALESSYRQVRSLMHTINYKYLPKNAEWIVVDDLRDSGEIIVREESQTETFLILIYLENNSPKGKLIVEDKCGSEDRYVTRSYEKKQVIKLGSDLVDSIVSYVDSLSKNKKAS
tara:strand:+ start:35 stop:1234 length:1200 start_codon:yes stop_codon:yes gene_type:complete